MTAVAMAVSHFNDGAGSTEKILGILGIKNGTHTHRWSQNEDTQRLQASEKRIQLTEKKIRQSLRQKRKGEEEGHINKEGVTYEAGGF